MASSKKTWILGGERATLDGDPVPLSQIVIGEYFTAGCQSMANMFGDAVLQSLGECRFRSNRHSGTFGADGSEIVQRINLEYCGSPTVPPQFTFKVPPVDPKIGDILKRHRDDRAWRAALIAQLTERINSAGSVCITNALGYVEEPNEYGMIVDMHYTGCDSITLRFTPPDPVSMARAEHEQHAAALKSGLLGGMDDADCPDCNNTRVYQKFSGEQVPCPTCRPAHA